MTPQQVETVSGLFELLGLTELHHGDCIGADADAHKLARACSARIVLHPPRLDRHRAWCHGDLVRDSYDYLTRNKHIVDDTSGLIATPKSAVEMTRSGTWSTVRYARKLNRPVWIVFPDGSHKTEEGE
jgi:hypothetical protein